MPRLSDRAFHIVKTEIERRYTHNPEDQIERVILLARLEALREKKGAPMTRVQIWEVLSDVAPNFDQNVLMDAESVETDSPLLGVSVGVGAVAVLVATAIGMDSLTPRPSIGSSPAESSRFGDESPGAVTRSASQKAATEQGLAQGGKRAAGKLVGAEKGATSQQSFEKSSSENSSSEKSAEKGSGGDTAVANKSIADSADEDPEPRNVKNQLSKFFVRSEKTKRPNAFDTAKGLGWQAALKSQDPPHSVQHWRETAALWEEALAKLDQVSPLSPHYIQAQLKKAVYRDNLAEIRSRQAAAQQLARQATRAAVETVGETGGEISGQAVGLAVGQNASKLATPTAQASPQFSNPAFVNQAAQTGSAASSEAVNILDQDDVAQPEVVEDPIQVAKRYGWQAALASQNAPHPPDRWADISRLWQTALSVLNKVKPGDARYAEAQQVKASYQRNLAAIRDRYQQEQTATQSLQSLQASLRELNNSLTPDAVKYGRMEAILGKLKTIPSGTEAHVQAQQLIVETTAAMNAIALTSDR